MLQKGDKNTLGCLCVDDVKSPVVMKLKTNVVFCLTIYTKSFVYFLCYSFLTLKYLASISNLSAASIASHLAAITLLCFKIQDFP